MTYSIPGVKNIYFHKYSSSSGKGRKRMKKPKEMVSLEIAGTKVS